MQPLRRNGTDITCRAATVEDAALLIEIYNAAFYDDFVRYGECPAYGRTLERMEYSIRNYPKSRTSVSLENPNDKPENLHFYIDICGFCKIGERLDGNVLVAELIYKKQKGRRRLHAGFGVLLIQVLMLL